MIAWFITTYKRDPSPGIPTRYCAIDDFFDVLKADNAVWDYIEVLGNYALVKVKASQSVLDTIAVAPGFLKIPLTRLNDSLSNLTSQQRNAVKTRLNNMGYSDNEILSNLGSNLALITLGDVLRFAARRRLKPRYDATQDQIVLDGSVQVCESVNVPDQRIQE